MPSPGLSLVGFMAEEEAVAHLSKACIPQPNATRDQLIGEWTTARANLGPPRPKAGEPEVLPLPPEHMAHAAQLVQQPWVQQASNGQLTPAHIWLVELDPLFAFQFTVDLERSGHHCNALASPPTHEELLKTCLPMVQASERFTYQRVGQSLIIKSRSLNIGIRADGMINNVFGGFVFGPALPFLHVTRLHGKCYLFNGYHRALGLRKAGATHAPCVLRDVPDALSAGVRDDGNTFKAGIFSSDNPPTVGHFTQAKAHNVTLRATSRILHVSWAEYVWPDDVDGL